MRLKSVFLSTAAACALALPAQAASVIITKDYDESVLGPTLVPFVTFGRSNTLLVKEDEPQGRTGPDDWLDGTEVTATFADNTSQSLIWATTDPEDACGGVSGLFSLSGCGDTYDQNWTLSYSGLSLMETLRIDFRPTDLWFDTFIPTPGTPGSLEGHDFTFISGTVSGTINATYSYVWTDEPPPGPAIPMSSPLENGASTDNGIPTPEWDTFKVLDLDFTDLDGGGFSGELVFRQDVDSVIPLPAALPLLLTGVGLLGVFHRRRKTA